MTGSTKRSSKVASKRHGRAAEIEAEAAAAEAEGKTVVRALPKSPAELTPDDVADKLLEWVGGPFLNDQPKGPRHTVYVEPTGPRRTWLLYENGKQVGHIRGRNCAAEHFERRARKLEASNAPDLLVRQEEHLAERCMDPTDEKWGSSWTWESAGAGFALVPPTSLCAYLAGKKWQVTHVVGEVALAGPPLEGDHVEDNADRDVKPDNASTEGDPA